MVTQVGHNDPVALSQASGNALPVHQGTEQAVEKNQRHTWILFAKLTKVEFHRKKAPARPAAGCHIQRPPNSR